MIVIDASAVVDLLLRRSRAASIDTALRGEEEAHAPDLLQPEVLAALRRWHAGGRLPPATVDQAVADFGELRIVAHPHGPHRARVWSLRDRLSPCDAHYVALAEALDARLLTTDDRLARVARHTVEVVAL